MADPTDPTCERCRNRYDFLGSERGRFSRAQARVVARGLKDYVLTDWQSLTGAFKLARDDELHREFARAAVAFQESFNFCFTCRRSVCPDCWNETDEACLSCQPLPEPVPAAAPALEIEPPAGFDGIRSQTLPPDLAAWFADIGGNAAGMEDAPDVAAPAEVSSGAVEFPEVAAVETAGAAEATGIIEEVPPVEERRPRVGRAAETEAGRRRRRRAGEARNSRRRRSAADAPAPVEAAVAVERAHPDPRAAAGMALEQDDEELVSSSTLEGLGLATDLALTDGIAAPPSPPQSTVPAPDPGGAADAGTSPGPVDAAGEPPVRWPRPTPWLERPLRVHGQIEGSLATTLGRRPIPVMARFGGYDAPADDGMPWLGWALSAPDGTTMSEALPEEPLLSAPGDEPRGPDLVCHNCGTGLSARDRFCGRCRLQVTRWSSPASVLEGFGARRA